MIWAIVDRLTKSTHFIPDRIDFSLDKLVELYVAKIVRPHYVPMSIILDHNPRFTSRFLSKLHEAPCTKLSFNTTIHTQTDEQSESMIQILKDMLRYCVMEFKGN